jgi:hypothetical protein
MAIFWGNRRLFAKTEPGVLQALKHPLLAGRPVIGRGAYSIILGGGKSVMKLTIDRSAYALAEHQSQWRCTALPEIHGLHGKVGELRYGATLLLIEMEALVKLRVGTTARKSCLSIAKQLRPSCNDDGRTPCERLRYVGTRQSDKSLAEGLALLAGFLQPRWPAVGLDLHSANFMCRPETGAPVICDPFMDMDVRWDALQDHALGLPPGTAIF